MLAGVTMSAVTVMTALSLAGAPPAEAAGVSPGYEIAFQTSAGKLATVDPNGTEFKTLLDMAPGTSPAVTGLSTGAALVAFQTLNRRLATHNTATNFANFLTDTMALSSSPAIVLDSANHTQALYQTDGNEIRKSIDGNPGSGLAPGGSPAAAWNLASGLHKTLFVPQDGFLREVTDNGIVRLVGVGVAVRPGTSPAVAAGTLDWAAAVNGIGGDLTIYRSSGGTFTVNDTGLALAADASPSIAALSTGGFVTAFVSGGTLHYLDGPDNPHDTGLAVSPGTSPAIAADGSGGWKIAYSAAAGDRLSTYNSVGQVVQTNSVLQAGTRPAIAALAKAAPASCQLSIFRAGAGQGFTARVDCSYRPGERFVRVEYRGSDPVFDDPLYMVNVTPPGVGTSARFDLTTAPTSSLFDEDGPFEDDEVYVIAHIVGNNSSEYTVRTNTVSGDFSPS